MMFLFMFSQHVDLSEICLTLITSLLYPDDVLFMFSQHEDLSEICLTLIMSLLYPDNVFVYV